MEIAYLIILILLNIKLLIHTGVLCLPIKQKVAKRTKNSNKILIQYPVMNEPMHLINRFIKSLQLIPVEERPRFHIQILDDYTDPLVLEEIPCISYEVVRRKARSGRQQNKLGYAKSKAGNMNYGLEHLRQSNSLKDYKFVMIYDADHEITDGRKIIEAAEILEANDDTIIVQSRWIFANTSNSLVSLFQEAQLGVHIDREQIFRSRYNLHPIMNGAGAMFKLHYIVDTFGGWLERCVVEDIDISYEITKTGKKIYVYPEWTTNIDNPETWEDLGKQWQKWAQGNGQTIRYHWNEQAQKNIFKEIYWFSWLNSFSLAPLKYFFLIWGGYRFFNGHYIHWIEWLCLVPHILAMIATGLNWDNSFNFKRFLLYPCQFILELRILHIQIYNWYKGFFNYKKELEFLPTPK